MIGGIVTSLTIRPVVAAGIATGLTAATITGAAFQQDRITAPNLRVEMGAVQLQALATSVIPAAVAPASVTTPVTFPPAAATAAVNTDPVQILTAAVQSAVGAIASALWFAAFPITLPLSVIGGFVSSVVQSISRPQASAAFDPLVGVSFFFTAPSILLTSGFSNLGLSATWTQHQFTMPFIAAAAPRAAAARKPVANTASAKPAAARSVKSAAAASQRAAKAAKPSAARSRHTS